MRLVIRYDSENPDVRRSLELIERYQYTIPAIFPGGYEPYFQMRARYSSAHASTAIEGNPLSWEQAMLVFVEGANDNPAGLEKLTLEEAYELMSVLSADKSTKVDEGVIRTMNSLLLKGLPDHQAQNRGRYRVSQNLIIDQRTREVRYRPPPPEMVTELMSNFVADIGNWKIAHPAPITAGLAHFALVSIHPFDDGTGRTARLVADMILELAAWSIQGMLSVSDMIFRRRDEYYDALRQAQGDVFTPDVDVTPFVRFHTEALVGAAEDLERRVVAFNKRTEQWFRAFPGAINPRRVIGLTFMIDIGPLSTSQYARLTKTSQSSALADLTDLVRSGLVVRGGVGKNTRYRVHSDVVQATQQ